MLACLISMPRLAIADEAPGPSGPLVEPIPIQDTSNEPPPVQENYEKPTLKEPIRPREIVIDVPGVRTPSQKIVLGSLIAAGVIGSAVGLYFHMESRSAANEVSESVFNGKTWTPERQDRFDDGERAKSRAAVGYAIGGAFVVGALVALIVTEPSTERAVIRPRHAGVVPVPGGAIAGAGWSF
jgi:hypothetical protein